MFTTSRLSLFLLASLVLVPSASSVSADGDFSVFAHPSKLHLLPPGAPIHGSPGAHPGAALACARVRFIGLSCLRRPSKYAHALKVHLSVAPLFRHRTIEICFHKNASIGLGMCPAAQWEKVSKGSWSRSISLYEDGILDVRMPPDPSRTVEVSTEEEFLFHRIVFLILGVVMMMIAHTLSQTVILYYGGAMTLGIILVLLFLFQRRNLLPTRWKSSLATFAYSSISTMAKSRLKTLTELRRVRVDNQTLMVYRCGKWVKLPGTDLLPGDVVSIGRSSSLDGDDRSVPADMLLLAGNAIANLAMLLFMCLVLVGAWFGYRGVQKFVLTEQGLVDSGVALFVQWAIMIVYSSGRNFRFFVGYSGECSRVHAKL